MGAYDYYFVKFQKTKSNFSVSVVQWIVHCVEKTVFEMCVILIFVLKEMKLVYGILLMTLFVSAIKADVSEKLKVSENTVDAKTTLNAESSIKEKRGIHIYGASPYAYHSYSPVVAVHHAPIVSAPLIHHAPVVSAPIIHHSSYVSAPLIHHSVPVVHSAPYISHPVVHHSVPVISHSSLVSHHYFKRR